MSALWIVISVIVLIISVISGALLQEYLLEQPKSHLSRIKPFGPTVVGFLSSFAFFFLTGSKSLSLLIFVGTLIGYYLVQGVGFYFETSLSKKIAVTRRRK